MKWFNILLTKLLDNNFFLLNFIPFICGIFLSYKNNTPFGIEFFKIYNKLLYLQNLIKNFINSIK